MKVTVDQQVCQGHTLCAMFAPNVFELDDEDGHSHPVSDTVPSGEEQAAEQAVASCPEQAIRLIEGA
ncbi:MAG: ferredoxin [Nocardioides sp.]|nr:ferredoxin [Nocardioides sp.]